ncbi:MAG: adenosine deaminase [Gemmatimonadota bacterium]|nr:adenosine deaminase [Gemmatimonadota bacterium]
MGLKGRPADREYIRSVPKVELHIHLEGTADPGLLARLCAGRESISRREVENLFSFSDFGGFLQAFRRVVELLREPEDFYQLACHLCRRLEQQGVLYAEVTFTPLVHTRRGLEHEKVAGCIFRALDEAAARGGPRVALIYDTVRQWGEGAAVESAGLAAFDKAAGRPVVGFGVGGDELSVPASRLKEAFDLAGRAGLKRYVHAGEAGGADSVWEALDVLGAERIGHGIASAGDTALMKRLADCRVALDVCPTSNLRTRVVGSIREHPLPILIESGVPVTLGSDDPGFFGAWLADEIELCVSNWSWDEQRVLDLMCSGARHSFLEPEEKGRLVQRISVSFHRPV